MHMNRRITASLLACVLCFTYAMFAAASDGRFESARDLALGALEQALLTSYENVYVYRDFAVMENHFSQKAKMFGTDGSLVGDMDENWRENPQSGESCIRCQQTVKSQDWGGWLFLNGCLAG